MSTIKNEVALEQALIAVICTANEKGININDLFVSVQSGIMGNKYYTHVGAIHKSAVISILEKAINNSKALIEIE